MTTLDLDTITLSSGEHRSIEEGACLLEAASFLAGEPWSDHPTCVSPVLGTYGRNLNDVLPDDTRQLLKPFVPRLLNTAGDGLDEQRSYLALDWLVRTYLPTWLRLVPALTPTADLLVASHAVVDLDSAARIGEVVRRAASKAAAARATAGSTAWAAEAAEAAGATAWDAVGAAAGATAWDAAWDAARAAAEAAAAGATAWYATWDVLQPTVITLQASAIDLLDRMIAPGGAGMTVSALAALRAVGLNLTEMAL